MARPLRRASRIGGRRTQLNGIRITVATGLYFLLLAPAAFAQPVERPETRIVERTDLSGHWRVPAQNGPKGSVTFSRRTIAADGDTYSVCFDLPAGRIV